MNLSRQGSLALRARDYRKSHFSVPPRLRGEYGVFLAKQLPLRRIHPSCQLKICLLGHAGQMDFAEEQ